MITARVSQDSIQEALQRLQRESRPANGNCWILSLSPWSYFQSPLLSLTVIGDLPTSIILKCQIFRQTKGGVEELEDHRASSVSSLPTAICGRSWARWFIAIIPENQTIDVKLVPLKKQSSVDVSGIKKDFLNRGSNIHKTHYGRCI